MAQKFIRYLEKKDHRVVGKVGVKLALTYKRLTLFKVLSQKKFTKLIIIFMAIANVLFTLSLVCGLQYVRSTLDRFRIRWNNYKYLQRIASEGATPKQNCFHQHFLRENPHGLLKDCEIRLIDKTDLPDPTRTEFFWMRKLKTLASLGLNVVEGVYKKLF